MNCKIVVMFMCILLIVSLAPDVCSFTNDAILYEESSFEKGCNCRTKNLIDGTPPDELSLECMVMCNPPPPLEPRLASPKPVGGDPPDEFSWKEYNNEDWTTPTRNQKGCGSCWDFAAVGVIECMINIQEGYADLDPDLSEQYVLSCLPEAGDCAGGNAYTALELIMETTPDGNYHNGVIPEWCFPYEANDTIPCSEKCADWMDLLVPLQDVGYWHPDGSPGDREAIKTQIIERGPVGTAMYADPDFIEWVKVHHDPEEYYPYTGPVLEINHVVVLIGWKDDPTISKGGYWICKNSWGPFSGYEGFFNIEYGTLNIDNRYIVWTEYDPETYDWDPVAKPGGCYSGVVEEEILFDASNSFDAEGPIALYEWDFGDGSNATGIIVTHTFADRGLYTVTLTVTDNGGNTDEGVTAALIDFWKTGDSWTYRLEPMVINVDETGQKLSFNGSASNMVFTVGEDAGDSFVLDFKGPIQGEFEAILNTGSSILDVSGRLLRLNTARGSCIFRSSDFALEKVDGRFLGISLMSIKDIPIPLPVPFRITFGIDFATPFTIFDVPFWVGKQDYFPPTAISIEITFGGILGFIKIPFDIEHLVGALTYKVMDMGLLTVEAGIYNAYHIITSFADIYFSPEVGTIIKIEAGIQDQFIFNGELRETNYS